MAGESRAEEWPPGWRARGSRIVWTASRGLVNVPAGMSADLQTRSVARGAPQGVNEPTAEGVAGRRKKCSGCFKVRGRTTSPCACLSGGGSALAARAGGRRVARGQAGDHEVAAPQLRGDHRRNELRAEAPFAREGRAARGSVSRQAAHLAHRVGRGRRPARRDRFRPDFPDPTTFADALAVLERYQRLSASTPTSRTAASGNGTCRGARKRRRRLRRT